MLIDLSFSNPIIFFKIFIFENKSKSLKSNLYYFFSASLLVEQTTLNNLQQKYKIISRSL